MHIWMEKNQLVGWRVGWRYCFKHYQSPFCGSHHGLSTGFKLCTKLTIRDCICNDWLKQVVEHKQLFYDVQEAVPWFKNAYNAVNHRTIFAVLKANGCPAEDIDLLQRIYLPLFFVGRNSESSGETAVLYLLRGVFLGAPSRPTMFILTFDPFHKMIRESIGGAKVSKSEPNQTNFLAKIPTFETQSGDSMGIKSILWKDMREQEF